MTEFDKFKNRFDEALEGDGIFDFECDADEFFHAHSMLICYTLTHAELVRQVEGFEFSRENFKVGMPDVYARAEKKFLNDWHEHAVAIGKRSADEPLPNIDDLFNKVINTLEQDLADAEQVAVAV